MTRTQIIFILKILRKRDVVSESELDSDWAYSGADQYKTYYCNSSYVEVDADEIVGEFASEEEALHHLETMDMQHSRPSDRWEIQKAYKFL